MQAIFPYQANGSQIVVNNQVVGSALIGQNFTSPTYFQPRPSALTGTNAKGATIPTPYDASESGGSTLGADQRRAADRRQAARRRLYQGVRSRSGAGRCRHRLGFGSRPGHLGWPTRCARRPPSPPPGICRPSTVIGLVNQMTHHAFLGIVGTDHVNVLQLNLALDHLSGTTNLAQGHAAAS